MNALENRLAEALAARAALVRPEDLRHDRPPVSVLPWWRRPVVVIAVAASLVVATTTTALLATSPARRTAPPSEPTPSVVLPADVGQDWGRAQGSPPRALDLDGDGTKEKVRFRAEPSKDFKGRLRLETTLSSDGSSVYGVVELGSTIGVTPLESIDADGDGDEELVLLRDINGMDNEPVVLDLRERMLVEAPPSEPGLLKRYTTVVPGAAAADHYEMVHRVDYWFEDGVLLSSSSRSAFASSGMSIFSPPTYVADVMRWRLRDDGVLVPEPADEPCVVLGLETKQPCADGAADELPPLDPVATGSLGIGETHRFSTGGYAFDLALAEPSEPDASANLVVDSHNDGRHLDVPVTIGPDPRASTTQPSGIFYDGASVVLTSGADDRQFMAVYVQYGDRMRKLETVGPVPLGTGIDQGRPYRSWLTENGALYTALAEDGDGDGAWRVYTWTMLRGARLAAVPVDSVCFEDVTTVSVAGRC